MKLKVVLTTVILFTLSGCYVPPAQQYGGLINSPPRTHYDRATNTMKRCAHVTSDGGCAHTY